MNNIQESIELLQTRLKEICPVIQPAIIPTYLYNDSLIGMLCGNNKKLESRIKDLLDYSSEKDCIAIRTTINYTSHEIVIDDIQILLHHMPF